MTAKHFAVIFCYGAVILLSEDRMVSMGTKVVVDGSF